MPKCTGSWCPRPGRRPPTTRRGSPRTCGARRARAAAGRQRRPVRISGWSFLRRRAAGVEQRGVARGAARARAHGGDARLDRLSHGPRATRPRREDPGRARDRRTSRAQSWWGDDVTSFLDGSSTSAPLTGVNYNAVYDECPQAAYAGIALEYGTLPFAEVLEALRADQWLTNHPDAPATRARRSSARSATRSTATRTTGKPPCTRRRSRPPSRGVAGLAARRRPRMSTNSRPRAIPDCAARRQCGDRAAATALAAPSLRMRSPRPGTATWCGASATRRWPSARRGVAVCVLAALFAPWLAPHNPFDLKTLNLSDALRRRVGRRGASRVPAGHRRPGPRRAVGHHVRRADVAARGPGVGRARDGARRRRWDCSPATSAAGSTRSSCAWPTSSCRSRRS